MRTPIGFVILTHSNPEQAVSLCARLTAQFDRPPIVIHHDFSQCQIDTTQFPENVRFVENWNKTNWGGFGIVEGVLKGLRLLYLTSDPDWFTVLSGADYPIKTAQSILEDLDSHNFDAYIDHRRIENCMLPIPTGGWGDQNYIHPAWIRLAFERYMAIGFGFFKLATRLRWSRKAIYLRSKFFIRLFTPFNGKLDCYAGDFWFTANRKSAAVLLNEGKINQKIISHFRKRPVPDEGMFQTMLCNAPDLKISRDNKRFTDWTGCVNHPRMLTERDFPALLKSTDHFARKLTFNPEALTMLDRIIDGEPLYPVDVT